MKIDLPYLFQGQTVTIVGGGPSLKGFDFSRLRQPVISINHAGRYVQSIMLVAIDAMFHEKEKAWLDAYKGYKVTYNDTRDPSFIKAEVIPDHGSLDLDWHIKKANLSGYFALALALHLGASRVFLLGYDGGYEGQNPNWHDHAYRGPGMNYYHPVNKYYDFFRDKPVINVGMDSLITSFPKVDINSDFYEYRSVPAAKV